MSNETVLILNEIAIEILNSSFSSYENIIDLVKLLPQKFKNIDIDININTLSEEQRLIFFNRIFRIVIKQIHPDHTQTIKEYILKCNLNKATVKLTKLRSDYITSPVTNRRIIFPIVTQTMPCNYRINILSDPLKNEIFTEFFSTPHEKIRPDYFASLYNTLNPVKRAPIKRQRRKLQKMKK